MYADELTDSMEKSISETNRRRAIQEEYNKNNGITPTTIKKAIRETIKATYEIRQNEEKLLNEDESIEDAINRLTDEMLKCAQSLDFEKAASLRDQIKELEKLTV